MPVKPRKILNGKRRSRFVFPFESLALEEIPDGVVRLTVAAIRQFEQEIAVYKDIIQGLTIDEWIGLIETYIFDVKRELQKACEDDYRYFYYIADSVTDIGRAVSFSFDGMCEGEGEVLYERISKAVEAIAVRLYDTMVEMCYEY